MNRVYNLLAVSAVGVLILVAAVVYSSNQARLEAGFLVHSQQLAEVVE